MVSKLLTDTKTKLPPSFTLVTVSNLWLIQSLNSHYLSFMIYYLTISSSMKVLC